MIILTRCEMSLTVRYDGEVDIMTIRLAPIAHIAVSSSIDFGLIADFGSEDGFDVVGVELPSAGKLLAPFCASNEKDAVKAESIASKFSIKYCYDKVSDILTVQTGYPSVSKSEVGSGLVAHFGYYDPACEDTYDMVGFELHNASECLAPWFKLNRASLATGGGDGD